MSYRESVQSFLRLSVRGLLRWSVRVRDEGMPRGGRLRACRARREAGNWRSDSRRASSDHVFSLLRIDCGVL